MRLRNMGWARITESKKREPYSDFYVSLSVRDRRFRRRPRINFSLSLALFTSVSKRSINGFLSSVPLAAFLLLPSLWYQIRLNPFSIFSIKSRPNGAQGDDPSLDEAGKFNLPLWILAILASSIPSSIYDVHKFLYLLWAFIYTVSTFNDPPTSSRRGEE